MEILMQKLMILAGTAAFALSLGAPTAQAAVSKPHSAISLECSKEADAKGLHGKTRKHFRAKCKREAEKSATAGTTGTTGTTGTRGAKGAIWSGPGRQHGEQAKGGEAALGRPNR
jgi:hypothetical protein